MNESKPPKNKERRYPDFYDKGIPIILGIIVVFIIILISIALAVIFGVF